MACQKAINDNLEQAILNDIKIEHTSDLLPEVFGQLTFYDKTIIFNQLNKITDYMNHQHAEWVINSICLEDGKSYLFTTSDCAKVKLEKLFASRFNKDNLLILNQFLLRKEIIKKAKQLI